MTNLNHLIREVSVILHLDMIDKYKAGKMGNRNVKRGEARERKWKKEGGKGVQWEEMEKEREEKE